MRNRALKFTILFASAGLIITLLIAYVERGMFNTYRQNVPYLTLLDNVKNQVTTSHLWLEELIAGDASLNYERDVQQQMRASLTNLQAAYDGQTTELGTFEQIKRRGKRALLKEAIFDLEKLIEAADGRWKHKNETTIAATDSTAAVITSKAGDNLDQQFDASFEQFQEAMTRLGANVDQGLKSDSSYLDLVSWASILLLVIAFAALCALLYRLQLSSSKMLVEHESRMQEQGKAVASLSGFIEAISAGNYSAELTLDENGANLGHTLITMRDKLRVNAEDDRRRNWSTSGLAQVGEILRVSTSSTADLYDNIIKFVVKYTKSNQGGLFILNEESENEKFLELVSCYAFERKKYLTKRINLGEGLVGQCYLEGEKIYLLEVPQEYITITSGLGGAAPNALLLVPLKVNEKIFGVLELATFGKYEDHEVELVEKLTESIASTISSVRISESTRILLEKNPATGGGDACTGRRNASEHGGSLRLLRKKCDARKNTFRTCWMVRKKKRHQQQESSAAHGADKE
jgi:GAF domain-containing protein